MQYLNKITQAERKISLTTKYFCLASVCVIIWFIPVLGDLCRFLDYQTYAFLNKSLLHSNVWQQFWGYLNHPHETWLNVIVMVAINLIGVATLQPGQRLKSFADVLYFWLFFQIVLFITYHFFSSWLVFERYSPSIVHAPWVMLSDALGVEGIKVYSNNSFPAGHMLVLVYWARFTFTYCNKQIKQIALATTIILGSARLFSGAHWISDIIFTIFYALMWFHIAQNISIKEVFTKFIVNKLKRQVTYEKCLH